MSQRSLKVWRSLNSKGLECEFQKEHEGRSKWWWDKEDLSERDGLRDDTGRWVYGEIFEGKPSRGEFPGINAEVDETTDQVGCTVGLGLGEDAGEQSAYSAGVRICGDTKCRL